MNLLTFAANRSSFKKNVLETREEFEDFVVKAIRTTVCGLGLLFRDPPVICQAVSLNLAADCADCTKAQGIRLVENHMPGTVREQSGHAPSAVIRTLRIR